MSIERPRSNIFGTLMQGNKQGLKKIASMSGGTASIFGGGNDMMAMMNQMMMQQMMLNASRIGRSNASAKEDGDNSETSVNISRSKITMDMLKDVKQQLSGNMGQEVSSFQKAYTENKERYLSVADELLSKAGVPNASQEKRETLAVFIASIHKQEANNKFDRYLHNGDKLGKETEHVPKGIYFGADEWEAAAADALKGIPKEILKSDKIDISKLMAFAESYNGMGYDKRGLNSPYVFGGTNLSSVGRYVSDGVFKADAKITQPGVYVLMQSMAKTPDSFSTLA